MRRVLGTVLVVIGLLLAVPVACVVLLGAWIAGPSTRSQRCQ